MIHVSRHLKTITATLITAAFLAPTLPAHADDSTESSVTDLPNSSQSSSSGSSGSSGSSSGSSVAGSSGSPFRCGFGFSGVSLDDPHADMSTAAGLGASKVRIPFGWRTVEPRKGEFDFADLDAKVDEALRQGLEPLLQIGGSNPRRDDSFTARDFRDTMHAVASHFRFRVSDFEIWNEPHISGFWDVGPNVASYAALLKHGYQGVKSANPFTTVVSAGVGTTKFSDPNIAGKEWFTHMVNRNAFDYADAVGVHPYSYPNHPVSDKAGGWQRMRDFIIPLLDRHGFGDKKIWITEYGEPTVAGKPGVGSSVLNQTHQAETYRQALGEWKTDPRIAEIFFYSLKDNWDARSTSERSFGVIRANNVEKKAADVLRNCG